MSEVHASLTSEPAAPRPGGSETHARLAHQSLARPLSPHEMKLADALEAIFISGVTDFSDVAHQLTARAVAAPVSGAAVWTADLLHQELAAVNAALDAAYAKG